MDLCKLLITLFRLKSKLYGIIVRITCYTTLDYVKKYVTDRNIEKNTANTQTEEPPTHNTDVFSQFVTSES